MSLLEITNLRASYGRVEVLHGIDLAINEGQIVAVLGANGAGKTSLLRAISNTIATQGARLLDGVDLAGLSTPRIASLGVGHVPEGRGTFADFTVEENLQLGALSRPKALRDEVQHDFELVYESFPILRDFRKRQAGALSGGQAQMLAIGRALLARPRLLLVDEPSLGLAPLTSNELFGRFAQLREAWSLTILLAEQNARLSLKVADRAVLLSRGQIVLEGATEDPELLKTLQQGYLGDDIANASESAVGRE